MFLTISMLFELKKSYAVDAAIMHEKERIIGILFIAGDDYGWVRLLEEVQVLLVNMAIFYRVDRESVPEFDEMYELKGTELMLFFNKRHMELNGSAKVRLYGNREELVDAVRKVYIQAKKGRFTAAI